MLASWNDGRAKHDIEDFVERVSRPQSSDFLPPQARVAVFDNDGTLWPEKPLPVELGFILQRLAGMAREDSSLREQQPWKAAYQNDYAWLGDVVEKHYAGDETGVMILIGGLLKAFAGMRIETYQAMATAYLAQARHPTLKRRFQECAYAPMVELLRYLEVNGFVTYIASGGDRDFMRVIAQETYGIPAERVVGSSNALCYTEDESGAAVAYLAKPDVFDDGPAKPVRIWSRIGRRPILAFGNSNGDIQMLKFTGGERRPALRLLLLHDDAQRDAEYVAGAEKALELAQANDWTVVSVKHDWKIIFAEESAPTRS
jgi:phosphoglycolate phosphatase-like HAD superfamily hydrolase